ncbi:MAG TPA: diaminopimelate decarboxylase [Candidatus Kapabacteria bacterium]
MPTTFSYKDSDGRAELWCEGVELAQIASQYGTPVYVYSKAQLLANLHEFTSTLQKFSDRGDYVSYAVKANSNPEILKILASEGTGADVVSGGELLAALKAGFAPKKVTYDGPGKTKHEITLALEKDIYGFNVESLEEIDTIDAIAGSFGKKAKISIRVNPDVDAKSHPYISTGMREHKFGIDIHHALDAYRYAAKKANIIIAGIHSHIGSQITELAPFIKAAKSSVAFVKQLRSEGIKLEHLNIGGGQAVHYHDVVDHSLLPSDSSDDEEPQAIPQLHEYVDAVMPILSEVEMRVMFEPGRAIVANTAVLLTEVLYKKSNPEKTFVIADAGMSDLIRPSLYQAYHQIAPLSLEQRESQKVDVVGPICESGDYLALSRVLPRIEKGELLAVMCTGAYGYVMASNYNLRPRPAEVMIDGNTHYSIRDREKIEDII